jgi:head-tail adaptor
MNAGDLDTLIEIFVPKDEPNTTGQVFRTFHLCKKMYANRRDLDTLKDNEMVMNKQQKVSFGITQFTVRYGYPILATYFIRCECTWFEIVGEPIRDGRKHFVKLNCRQSDNNKIVIE